MKKLYVSTDSGTIYKGDEIDPNDDGYYAIEVPEVITLTPDEICGGYGQIVEILLRAGKIKTV